MVQIAKYLPIFEHDMLNDTNKHKGLRNQLVGTIKRKGIKDESVLLAISKVPRHLFMDSGFVDFAYQDKPFPIGEFIDILPDLISASLSATKV